MSSFASSSAKILAFCGSARKDSFNGKLLDIAIAGARDAGANVTLVNLRDFALPIFDEELEADHGAPTGSIDLHRLARAQDGFLIGCPEYNGGVTPLLKNAIDWLSRPQDDQEGGVVYRGKTVAIVSATAGISGGARVQGHLRQSLQGLGCLLVPESATLPSCHRAFQADGTLKDQRADDSARLTGRRLAEIASRMTA